MEWNASKVVGMASDWVVEHDTARLSVPSVCDAVREWTRARMA